MQDNLIIFPEPPPGDASQLVPSALPVSLTKLVGREHEVQAIQALLVRPDTRLLTLTGTAGVGKTRLAFEVARVLEHEFADGIHVVSLAPISDPDLVIPTIAHRLGLMESGSQPVLDLLKMSQRNKDQLLVLDNFEQVIEAAPLLAELLEACPDLKLLITSREVLRLRGEQQFVVPPLTLPDPRHLPDAQSLAHVAAVTLFLQRAQAIRSDFHVTTDNATSIAQICLRLDGLPLAIELAAARVKVLSPQALLARLDRRLHVLTGGARDLPERQQTLRNTLAWSYDLLEAREQRIFRRLSDFAGGCTLEALEAICDAPGDASADLVGSVLECVASLIDKSLVQQIPHEGEQSRLSMLETIREYGLEALASCGEAQTTREAHAAYYLALVEQAEPELMGPQQLSWFERLEWEHDNLRAALSWLLEQDPNGQYKEFALHFSGALFRFWRTRGYESEGRRWLKRALDESRGIKSATRAKALTCAGHLAALQDDVSQADVLCGEGLALYRELGDRRGSATALTFLGFAALLKSNYTQACARLEEALTLFKEVGDTVDSVLALSILGSALFRQGEYARAQSLLEKSLRLSETAGNIRDRAFSLVVLGTLLLFQGDLAQAQARLEESLAVSRKVGYKRNLGLANHLLGVIAFQQGDMARASSLYEESLVLFREVGEPGRIAAVLCNQGLISLSQGDYVAACALLEESLQLSFKLNQKWNIVEGLEGVAAVLAAQGEQVRAVQCMSAAQALREAIGAPLPLIFQQIHESTLASTHRQLEEQAFAAAWAEGRSMPLEHILAAQEPVAVPMMAPAGPPSIPHPQQAPSASAGLTSRELDVLRLLVQGLTSSQIAEQLVIGQVTVNSHVRSIYSKLGVTSRAAATRYALEHHLL